MNSGETPWGEMLRAAMRMGIAPEAFWRLSLKEWRMLTAAPRGTAPMGRPGLTKLMEDWPDDG
ncbi:phage tail assembly chaperone [Brevundimonas sp. TSRC1-1]|uniref:phage tail assembly chaperone n=1 Tax=Brevundimonas sp. TSRC1-1 TaxID=2804562 RepID=UPI003CF2CA8A